MFKHIIEPEIINGPGKGKTVTIPRNIFIEPFKREGTTIRWKQYLIKIAYALTIDKAQGQSLECVGVYLISECFAHGQLYTAISCAKYLNAISFYIPPSQEKYKTKNIVWKEVSFNWNKNQNKHFCSETQCVSKENATKKWKAVFVLG